MLKKFNKNLSEGSKTFENILENGAFSIFHNIIKYMIFQRRQKTLLWREGLMKIAKFQASSLSLLLSRLV